MRARDPFGATPWRTAKAYEVPEWVLRIRKRAPARSNGARLPVNHSVARRRSASICPRASAARVAIRCSWWHRRRDSCVRVAADRARQPHPSARDSRADRGAHAAGRPSGRVADHPGHARYVSRRFCRRSKQNSPIATPSWADGRELRRRGGAHHGGALPGSLQPVLLHPARSRSPTSPLDAGPMFHRSSSS